MEKKRKASVEEEKGACFREKVVIEILLENVLLSWSGGKDSSLALYEVTKGELRGKFNVVSLITTVTKDFERISMHGVRRELLLRQARALSQNLEEVWIPRNASNQEYETQMAKALEKYKREKGITSVVFGDLFLEDIRKYREERLAWIGLKGEFPLWHKNTKELANSFIDLGFKAIVCCVNPKYLSQEFCGRDFDESFLSSLPESVDPCGENGEFHTFVYEGPIFEGRSIKVKKGEVVLRDGFCFADIIPD